MACWRKQNTKPLHLTFTGPPTADKTRQQILNVATYNLLKDVLGHTYYMLKVAGLAHRPGVWWNGMRFLFGRQGIWRPLVGDWKKFKTRTFTRGTTTTWTWSSTGRTPRLKG